MSKLSAEYELNFLAACLSELEAFLLSNEIYQALSLRAPLGEKPYPQFTLGWMRLFQIRAQAKSQFADDRFQINRISDEIERTRTKWHAAWAKKALKEFSARLNLWRDFLIEFRINPEGNIDRYDYEVNRRVLLELLCLEIDQLSPAETEALAGLDSLLKAIFAQGEFIWEEDLKGSFPKSTYWYLFGRPDTKFSY